MDVKAILLSPHFASPLENLNVVFLEFYFPPTGLIPAPPYLPPVGQPATAKTELSEYQLSTCPVYGRVVHSAG